MLCVSYSEHVAELSYTNTCFAYNHRYVFSLNWLVFVSQVECISVDGLLCISGGCRGVLLSWPCSMDVCTWWSGAALAHCGRNSHGLRILSLRHPHWTFWWVNFYSIWTRCPWYSSCSRQYDSWCVHLVYQYDLCTAVLLTQVWRMLQLLAIADMCYSLRTTISSFLYPSCPCVFRNYIRFYEPLILACSIIRGISLGSSPLSVAASSPWHQLHGSGHNSTSFSTRHISLAPSCLSALASFTIRT